MEYYVIGYITIRMGAGKEKSFSNHNKMIISLEMLDFRNPSF